MVKLSLTFETQKLDKSRQNLIFKVLLCLTHLSEVVQRTDTPRSILLYAHDFVQFENRYKSRAASEGYIHNKMKTILHGVLRAPKQAAGCSVLHFFLKFVDWQITIKNIRIM